jgi:acyl-CoA hydrolase
MESKSASNSAITMTELVLPNHTNQLGNLLGGQLMLWVDICAALAAAKHSQRVCVTASVDKVDFHNPIRLGDAVTILSQVNRVFNTSMEVGVKVYSECFRTGTKVHTNSAYLTFVSVDETLKPVRSFHIFPETDDEKRRFEEALRRREYRLKTR